MTGFISLFVIAFAAFAAGRQWESKDSFSVFMLCLTIVFLNILIAPDSFSNLCSETWFTGG